MSGDKPIRFEDLVGIIDKATEGFKEMPPIHGPPTEEQLMFRDAYIGYNCRCDFITKEDLNNEKQT